MIRRSSEKAPAGRTSAARSWNLHWLISALGSSAVLYGFDVPPCSHVDLPGRVDWDAELASLLADD